MRAPGLFLVFCLACATATPPPPPIPDEPTPLPAAAPAAPPPVETCTSFARPGVLRRSAVSTTVDAGMGNWLKGVVVDAQLQKGRFRGWVIQRLYPGDVCYREVDLRPGDLVLKVNEKSIERPEQALQVFQSLRSAPALVVEFVRAGAPMKLSFQIE